MTTTTSMTHLPQCDFCAKKAEYDGKTAFGPWASLCRTHFYQFGIGLGTGKGQRLTLKKTEKEKEKTA
jgi:hypothetical protein